MNGFSGMAKVQFNCHRLAAVSIGCDFFFLMHPLFKPLMLIIIETEHCYVLVKKGVILMSTLRVRALQQGSFNKYWGSQDSPCSVPAFCKNSVNTSNEKNK